MTVNGIRSTARCLHLSYAYLTSLDLYTSSLGSSFRVVQSLSSFLQQRYYDGSPNRRPAYQNRPYERRDGDDRGFPSNRSNVRSDQFGGHRSSATPHSQFPRPMNTVHDFNEVIRNCAFKRKAFLLKDVYDEMSLNGIPGNFDTYYSCIVANGKAKRLGDTLYFFEEMRRHGIAPNAAVYAAVITACGRVGNVNMAIQLKEEMLADGLTSTRSIYMAMMQAFGEAGNFHAAQQMFVEMEANGFSADTHAFVSLINAYRNATEHIDNYAVAVCDLMDRALFGVMYHDSNSNNADPHAREQMFMMVYNAVLRALEVKGYHQMVIDCYNRMQRDGGRPDSATYATLITSYLKDSTGTYKTVQRGGQGGGGVRPHVAGRVDDHSADEHHGNSEEGAWDGASQSEEQQMMDEKVRALQEVSNLQSFYEALRIKEQCDQQQLGVIPQVYHGFIAAALKLMPLEPKLMAETAHGCMTELLQQGYYLNGVDGGYLLFLASQLLISDLSMAHRIWEHLMSASRPPRTSAAWVYFYALRKHEPHNIDRINKVLNFISSDPKAAGKVAGVRRQYRDEFQGPPKATEEVTADAPTPQPEESAE